MVTSGTHLDHEYHRNRPSRIREGYVFATSEGTKLARLFEKYGIASEPVNSVHSVNYEEDMQPSSGKQEPLII